MFRRFSTSWELVQASFAVLRADKELLVFPLISMFGVLLVTITFAIPTFILGAFESMAEGSVPGAGVVLGFLFYVSQYCVIFFANTALVGAAMIRLDGGDPTVGDGFRIASNRFGAILGYALIAATVGMILRAISERGGIVGQIASSLLGFAWNVATYLVVPILAVEDIGPVDAVKRSAQLLKKTWGEQLVGEFSIGMVFGLIGLGVCLLGLPIVVVAVGTGSVALIVLAILLLVLALAAIGVLSAALSGIYSAAVYRYAVQGNAGGYFSEQLVRNTFRQK